MNKNTINKLEKSFNTKKELNPLLFDNNKKLKPIVRAKLLEIAGVFKNSLELSKEPEVKDIILTGSLANYNWSTYSDIDLHLVFNFSEINKDFNLVSEYFLAQKALWEFKYNVKIYDYDVELYGQDEESEELHSAGVYSILNDKWLSEPEYVNYKTNIEKLSKKADVFISIIDKLIESNINIEKKLELIKKLRTKIRNYRQRGLEEDGEYSDENLVFKILRRTDYIQKLKDYKQELLNKKLSLIKENDEVYYSKYIKPIKIDERLTERKKNFDKNISIIDNELTYNGDVSVGELKMFEKFYSNYVINIEGNVNISNCNLKEIPIQFGDVEGWFDCEYNHLTSLKNCPINVNLSFYCGHNLLKSLEYCPENIGKEFYFNNNSLTSLDYFPIYVGGSIHCRNNPGKFTIADVDKVFNGGIYKISN